MNNWTRYDWIALPIVLIIGGSIISVLYGSQVYSCASTAQVMNVNYRYGLFIGCMVEFEKGKWGPIQSVRGVR